MQTSYKNVNDLKIASDLLQFVNKELLKDIDIKPEKFWKEFSKEVHELAKKNRELLQKREIIQKKIDNWHLKNRGKKINLKKYKVFSRN